MQPEKLPLETPNPTTERLEYLRDLFPEAFTEGQLDTDKLRALLGEPTITGRERYGLTWHGKTDAIKLAQHPTTATLRPDPAQSINFDTTGHVIIEGDNLEVLKLLQRAYHGAIKMIYIDPPYNTGNDFVYPDDFKHPLRAYLEMTGQTEDGVKRTTRVEANGRYHSRWLSMMYPRLQLAKSLLRDDGVIFISIDDHEQHNLKNILNEIFGEENFVAELVWEKTRKNDAKLFSVGHEYMYVYVKSLAHLKELKMVWRESKPGAKEILEKYKALRGEYGTNDEAIQEDLRKWYASLPQDHPSKKLSRYKWVDKFGPWRDRDISWPGGGGPTYDVIHPRTKKPCKVPERGWVFPTIEGMEKQINLGLVVFRDDHAEPPFRKAHLIPVPEELEDTEEIEEFDENGGHTDDETVGLQVMPSVIYKQSQVAVKYLRKLMGGKIFDNPKDHEVLARLFRYVGNSEKDDIILDFFAGSGSAAEAVLTLNREDKGSRRFVLVQFPEETPEKSPARKAGYETISQLTRSRVSKVIENIKAAQNGSLNLEGTQDLGFRAFTLSSSNFLQWDAENPDIEGQLEALISNVRDDRSEQDIFWEIMMKSGVQLSENIDTLTVNNQTVYATQDGKLMVVLTRPILEDTMRRVMDLKPDVVVCLDVAFEGNDALKTNIVLEMKDKNIAFRTV